VLLVPGEAAELDAVEAWAERGRGAGELRILRAVSHVRAPYALRASQWDLVVCDLASGEDDALALVQVARAAADAVPFVLIEPAAGAAQRDALTAQGGTVLVPRARLAGERIARAVAQATGRPHLRARVGSAGPEVRVRNTDLVPAMLFRTDSGGGFTHFSREWTRFTGRGEALERGRGWLEGLHPADQSRWSSVFDSAVESGAPFEVDLRVKRAGSEYRWLRLRGVPRSGAEGFDGSAFDVTDLVQRAVEADRLEGDNRDLRQFAYAVAHDLQEPLRAVGGWLRQAVDVAPGESIEPIGRALDSLEQAQHMLRDLLDCAAVGTSGGPLAVSDLREPLEWALSNLSAQVAESAANIEVRDLGSARCDAPQVARVFQNLIANALKFRGDAPPHVVIASERVGEQLRVSVSDNGIGIDVSFHGSIFEIFQRVPGAAAAGSGVGLALCKRIVERHGGRICVASQPGRGARFEFTLPAS
jgi:signal transduction histidine kinase